MRRTIWPVGHGAFYTEVFDNPCKISVVYDCGGKTGDIIKDRVDIYLHELNRGRSTRPTIDIVFISHFHNDHINGLPYLLRNANVKNIVLPQIDTNALLEAYIYNAISNVNNNYGDISSEEQEMIFRLATNGKIDTEANQVFVNSYHEENESSNQEPIVYDEERSNLPNSIASGYAIQIRHISPIPWEYIPVNIYNKDNEDKIKRLKKALIQINSALFAPNGKVNFYALVDYLKNNPISEIRKIYEKIFGSNDNIYSMPVYSGPVGVPRHPFIVDRVREFIWSRPRSSYFYFDDWRCSYMPLLRNLRKRLCACLYMGDFEPNNKYNNNTFVEILRTTLKDRWHYLGLQQIPHHASRNNYCDDLYDHSKLCFANVDDYKDSSCSFTVLQDIIRNDCFPIVVTEEKNPLVFEIY